MHFNVHQHMHRTFELAQLGHYLHLTLSQRTHIYKTIKNILRNLMLLAKLVAIRLETFVGPGR